MNPHYVLFCNEYNKAKKFGLIDYILTELIDDNTSWELTTEFTNDPDADEVEAEPCIMLYAETNNGCVIEGKSFEWYYDDDNECWSEDCYLKLSKEDFFIAKIEFDSEDEIYQAICEEIRDGKADNDFYEGYIPNWVGYEDVVKDDNEIGIEDFIIRTTGYRFVHHNHTLDRIIAIVKVMTNSGIQEFEVEAMYCEECNEYYISEIEFEKIREYGTLCHKVVTEKEYLKMRSDYKNWAEKSILSSYGYTVNAKDDLSDVQRQNILNFIISEELMDIDRVILFLEWLVKKRGHNFYNAKLK